MTACQAITKCDTPCSRKALKSGFCTQHDKDKRIEMYKKELSRMHKRVKRYLEISNDLHEKVTTIQHVDWLKYNLLMIGGAHCPYRCIIDNPGYKNQIEALFDLPANAALKEYDRLLKRRNELVHKYTIDGLNGARTTNQKYCEKAQISP